MRVVCGMALKEMQSGIKRASPYPRSTAAGFVPATGRAGCSQLDQLRHAHPYETNRTAKGLDDFPARGMQDRRSFGGLASNTVRLTSLPGLVE